jgi:hypothetical protein
VTAFWIFLSIILYASNLCFFILGFLASALPVPF